MTETCACGATRAATVTIRFPGGPVFPDCDPCAREAESGSCAIRVMSTGHLRPLHRGGFVDKFRQRPRAEADGRGDRL